MAPALYKDEEIGLYKNLKKINLEGYLNECCGSKNWHRESWLLKLDTFVGTLSEENLNTLRSKFVETKNDQEAKERHRQYSDELNEVMVACGYHPTALFVQRQDNKKTYDLFDKALNLKIEVKTLNESVDEQIRHNNQKPNTATTYIGKALSDSELENIRKSIIVSLEKKCSDKLTEAVCQLENEGKIYLIYDYDILFKNLDHLMTHAPLSKEEIKRIIENYCINFSTVHNNIAIESIYFEDLREKVSNY